MTALLGGMGVLIVGCWPLAYIVQLATGAPLWPFLKGRPSK